MKSATLSARVDAPIEPVRAALLAAPRLPEWNPAFTQVIGAASATPGDRYVLEAMRGLRGTLHYPRITTEEIIMTWRVPGMTETGTWELAPEGAGGGTIVTHTVRRSGPLAMILHSALATLPGLRLDRLTGHLSIVNEAC